MTPPDTLFLEDTAGRFHPADPWTSKAAARSASLRSGTTRYRILAELIVAGYYGRTAYELGARLDLLAHVAGTRLGELAAIGYVERRQLDDGTTATRPTDTGRPAEVYVITSAGLDAYSATGAGPAARVTDAPRSAATRPPGRPSAPRRPSPRGLTRAVDCVLEAIVDATANPVTRGLTDVEAAAAVGILRNAAGTHRKNLERAGLVERTDRTRKTDRGHAAGIYVATPAGRDALERLSSHT